MQPTLEETLTDIERRRLDTCGAPAPKTCTARAAGNFVINPTSTTGAAANVKRTINACEALFSTVGWSPTFPHVITVSDAVTGTYSTITPNPNSNQTWHAQLRVGPCRDRRHHPVPIFAS